MTGACAQVYHLVRRDGERPFGGYCRSGPVSRLRRRNDAAAWEGCGAEAAWDGTRHSTLMSRTTDGPIAAAAPCFPARSAGMAVADLSSYADAKWGQGFRVWSGWPVSRARDPRLARQSTSSHACSREVRSCARAADVSGTRSPVALGPAGLGSADTIRSVSVAAPADVAATHAIDAPDSPHGDRTPRGGSERVAFGAPVASVSGPYL